MIAEGNYVANRYTIKATHQNTYRGIKPTGKQITYSGIEINRIVDGKFVETWGISDTFGLMQQLGAIPKQ
jgi:predicted ester cyclase